MEKNIIKKITEIMHAVGAVPKDGKNTFQNYAYRRHEDIVNKLQPALAAAGVVFVPSAKKIIASEPGYVLLEVTYTVTDGESSVSCVGLGEGVDKSKDGRPGDKAAYKAQTGAMKYALNDLLMLAASDPEEDQVTHGGKPQVAQPRPKTEAAPEPAKKAPAPEVMRIKALLDTMEADTKTRAKYNEMFRAVGAEETLVAVQAEFDALTGGERDVL